MKLYHSPQFKRHCWLFDNFSFSRHIHFSSNCCKAARKADERHAALARFCSSITQMQRNFIARIRKVTWQTTGIH